MNKGKTKKAKETKSSKVRPIKVVKAAKSKAIASKSVSVKKTAIKKVTKKTSSVKNTKLTKELVKGNTVVKKITSKKEKAKSTIKKAKGTEPVKVLKTGAKKKSDKKEKSNTNKNKLAIADDKLAKTKKNKVIEGIESNKVKSAGAASRSKRSKKKKKGDDDDEPIIDVEDALLAEILETVKPKKKNSKEPKQIRTFVNPMASLTVAKVFKEGKRTITNPKEPKGKFILEFVLGTSPAILYEFLTTPSGLSEWFADDVNIHDGVFTFFWDGSEQKALLLDFKEEKYIRFQWIDKPEGTYFEFKIEVDELTGDVSLMVTDFADEGSDLETSKRLWDSQIHTLMHVIGSY